MSHKICRALEDFLHPGEAFRSRGPKFSIFSPEAQKTFYLANFGTWATDIYTQRREGEIYLDPEILTEKVATQNKKFLVDLKRNENGYYLKVSEWSNSKKSSIFIPAEGVGRMIEVLRKFQNLIQDGDITDIPPSRN